MKALPANDAAIAAAWIWLPTSLPKIFRDGKKKGAMILSRGCAKTTVMWAGDRIVNRFGVKARDCVYLNWDGTLFSCEIYETRPLICRNFIPGSSALCPQYNREG